MSDARLFPRVRVVLEVGFRGKRPRRSEYFGAGLERGHHHPQQGQDDGKGKRQEPKSDQELLQAVTPVGSFLYTRITITLSSITMTKFTIASAVAEPNSLSTNAFW